MAHRRWVSGVVGVAALAACSGGTSASEPVAHPTTDLTAFCAKAATLSGERPESYVGSAENLADVVALSAVAPADIRPSLAVYRRYLASGAITPSDPDSNLTDHWPKDVQAAVRTVTDDITALC